MQEAPIWGAAGWIEPLNFGASYDIDDMLPAIRNGLSHEGTLYAAPFYGESDGHVPQGSDRRCRREDRRQ